jgi:polycomb protein SUZ12
MKFMVRLDKIVFFSQFYLQIKKAFDSFLFLWSVGDFRIPVNPKENSKNGVHVRLLKEHLTSNGKHLLVFTANLPRYPTSTDTQDLCSVRNGEETNVKRRKCSVEVRKFRAELLLFAKNHENLLKDGEYHVVLNDCAVRTQSLQQSVQEKFKKVIFWEQSIHVPGVAKDLSQEPCISFFLVWSNDLFDGNGNQSVKAFCWKAAQPLKQIEPLNGDYCPKSDLKLHSFQIHSNGIQRRDSSIAIELSGPGHPIIARNGASNSLTKVIYRFVHNNKFLQQTKAAPDFLCPWCSLFCAHFASLRQHLKFCHNRFAFSFTADKESYKIDVAINDNYDGSYSGNPQFDRSNGLVHYSGPNQRIPVTHILINLKGGIREKLNELLEETLDSEFIKPFVYGHNRLYYHSGTCQPIRPHELDVDSEDETDPEWMRIKTQLVRFEKNQKCI